jgi:anthranilate synthase component I
MVRPVKVPGLPEFTGGAVGYIGYDCVRYFEPTTDTELTDVLKIPDAVLLLCDSIVVFDHLYSMVKVVSNVVISETASPEEIKLAYDAAVTKIDSIIATLQKPEIEIPPQPKIVSEKAESNIGKAGYEKFVVDLKRNIAAGDIIQVVPSQRVTKPTNLHPFNAYRMLRTVNPAPYMFYISTSLLPRPWLVPACRRVTGDACKSAGRNG